MYIACTIRSAASPEAPLLAISALALAMRASLRCASESSSVGTEILALPWPMPRTSWLGFSLEVVYVSCAATASIAKEFLPVMIYSTASNVLCVRFTVQNSPASVNL